MGFKLGGISCHISFGFFTLLSVYMLLDKQGMGFPILCAVAVHESGHLLFMAALGGRVERVELAAYGVRIEKRGLLPYEKELAIYLGGICANFIAVAACLAAGKGGVFLYANLLLAVFNLLPVGRLDGGVILRLLLERAGKIRLAPAVHTCVGVTVLLPLFAAALWMAKRGNVTLLLTCLYLFATLFHGGS